MIFTKSRQQVFQALTAGILVMFFLSSCSSSSNSSSDPIVEVAAVPSIVGKVVKADGSGINDVAVDLGSPAKDSTVTDTSGAFTIKPPAFGDYQLFISKKGFVTQVKDVTVSDAGVSLTPITLKAVDVVKTISSSTGGAVEVESVVASKKVGIAIPANAATGASIEVSMSLLSGNDIPSTLPTEAGKTLLPVGTVALGITPAGTVLTKAATATVPVPEALKESDRTFDVYSLSNGVWSVLKKDVNNIGGNVAFQVSKAGTYMVMTTIEDVSAASSGASTTTTPTTTNETVTPGATVKKTVTDKIGIAGLDGADADEKAEIEALVTSLLEKQLDAKFGAAQELSVTAPAAEDTANRLVCVLTFTRSTFVRVFQFNTRRGSITIIVTITIERFKFDCKDVQDTGAAGGTG